MDLLFHHPKIAPFLAMMCLGQIQTQEKTQP